MERHEFWDSHGRETQHVIQVLASDFRHGEVHSRLPRIENCLARDLGPAHVATNRRDAQAVRSCDSQSLDVLDA